MNAPHLDPALAPVWQVRAWLAVSAAIWPPLKQLIIRLSIDWPLAEGLPGLVLLGAGDASGAGGASGAPTLSWAVATQRLTEAIAEASSEELPLAPRPATRLVAWDGSRLPYDNFSDWRNEYAAMHKANELNKCHSAFVFWAPEGDGSSALVDGRSSGGLSDR